VCLKRYRFQLSYVEGLIYGNVPKTQIKVLYFFCLVTQQIFFFRPKRDIHGGKKGWILCHNSVPLNISLKYHPKLEVPRLTCPGRESNSGLFGGRPAL
jgi:hypothetical protein